MQPNKSVEPTPEERRGSCLANPAVNFYPFAQENQHIGENIEMELKFLSQPSVKFDIILKEHLRNHEVVLIATAYITEDGISKIENELLQKRSVKIVCGVHGCISDLRALKSLVSRSNNIVDGKVFLGTNVFHPKLYIFQKFDSTTLLIGSCNLTGTGLQNNEETVIEIIGPSLSPPIVDALSYFDNIWNTNSVSVDNYLIENPDYSVKHNHNDILTSEQKQKLELIKKTLSTEKIIVFKNLVNKTFRNKGKQTVPTRFNNIIDEINLCTLHNSIRFKIILPNGETVPGQMYYGDNNTGNYYQFKISGGKNIEKLKKQVNIHNLLEHSIDLTKKIVNITLV